MGALLGAGLGALLGVAGGYEKAQAQKRMDEHGAVMDLIKAHPEMGNDPDFQAMAKKKGISPEYLQLVGAVGKGNAAFQGDVQKATADSPAGQLMGAPGAAQGPQGTAQPAAGVDPLVQHIQMVDRNIANLEKLLPKYMNDPAKVKVIQDTLSEFRQHRAEYAIEERQTKSEAFSEKMTGEREAAAEARQDKAIGAMSERMSQTMAHSEYLEGLRENFRERLETMKDAKTTAQQRRAFTTTLAGLSKTRSQIEARANKAPDQTTRQAEVDTFNSGLDTLKLGMDDPDKIKQLESLRLSVGEAKPKYLGLSETPGTVTPETPDAGGSVDPAEAAFRKKHGL